MTATITATTTETQREIANHPVYIHRFERKTGLADMPVVATYAIYQVTDISDDSAHPVVVDGSRFPTVGAAKDAAIKAVTARHGRRSEYGQALVEAIRDCPTYE